MGGPPLCAAVRAACFSTYIMRRRTMMKSTRPAVAIDWTPMLRMAARGETHERPLSCAKGSGRMEQAVCVGQ